MLFRFLRLVQGWRLPLRRRDLRGCIETLRRSPGLSRRIRRGALRYVSHSLSTGSPAERRVCSRTRRVSPHAFAFTNSLCRTSSRNVHGIRMEVRHQRTLPGCEETMRPPGGLPGRQRREELPDDLQYVCYCWLFHLQALLFSSLSGGFFETLTLR